MTERWSLPASWRWKALREIGIVVGGGTPNTRVVGNFDPSGAPWITPADLSGYLEPYIAGGRRALSARGLASSGATLLPQGSVMFPEPTDDDKIFRFEQVTFRSGEDEVDYASLSDGEHQLAQILGVFAMVDHDNALFLLDEPESHFNPQWRVKFAERIQSVRTETANGSRQEVILRSACG